MKTSSKNRSTPYLNRRDQYRMLAMVGLLCLVMVAIKVAALPESWHWIVPPQDDGDQRAVPLEELDFRVKQNASAPLPPDVFRAVADTDDPRVVQFPDSEVTGDAEIEQPSPLTAEIDAHVLATVEDNTVGVRREEIEAYHQMLARIARLPEDVIESEARNDVAFTVIMLQSDDYRGQIVGITGQLRRLTEFPVIENVLGIDLLYEGWVFTNDSGNNPWRFLCTQIPAGANLGDQFEPVKVQLAGYFFKRAGYLSHGGQHVAPTLLAKTFRIVPAPIRTSLEMPPALRQGLVFGIGILFAAVVFVVIRWSRGDREFATGRLGKLAAARLDADPDDLKALEQIDPVDPSAMFEQDATAEPNIETPSP